MNWKVFDFNVIYTEESTVYLEKKGKVYISLDYGDTIKYLASYPCSIFEKMGGAITRIVRGGLHSFVVLPNGAMVAVKRKAILFKSKDSDSFKVVFDIIRGSRPLKICYNPVRSKLYFGEYFSNRDRDEVYIYSSKDGQKWVKAYTFSAGSIRHIHGIFFDKYRNGMWILTGDLDEECHLWYTPDDFGTVESVVGGTQNARAVSIIPLEETVIVPTDTPLEKNSIQLFDIMKKELHAVSDLPGSAFYAESIGNINVVSTVLENSEVNSIDFVSVYASVSPDKWTNILNLKQDFYSKLSLKLFSYPQIKFSTGCNRSEYLFLNCKGVKKYESKCLRIPKSEILQSIYNS